MKNTITTINGKTVTIEPRKTYTVIYATKEHPNDLKIIESIYLDNLAAAETQPRLYFDETFEECLINAVFTTEEWQHNLKQMVADFTFF